MSGGLMALSHGLFQHPCEATRPDLTSSRPAASKPENGEKTVESGQTEPKPTDSVQSTKRVLDPLQRVSEVLFGLIMVLTFTGSLSVVEAGREDIRVMLIGALGCNLVWGIIDAVLYLMGCLAEKSRGLLAFRAVRKSADPHAAQQLIAAALPAVVASIMEPSELETIRQRLMSLPEPPEYAGLGKRDLLGALGVFLLVFLSTFPVVIPFIIMRSAGLALLISNAIAIVMLFITGYAYGRMVGHHPMKGGIAMVLLGLVLVALAKVLGG